MDDLNAYSGLSTTEVFSQHNYSATTPQKPTKGTKSDFACGGGKSGSKKKKK